MASSSVSSVREIIDTQLTDKQIIGCMAASIELVCSRLNGKGLSGSLTQEIKRWVCAHFVSIRDPSTSVQEEKLGEATVTYLRQAASSMRTDGILSSPWGRTAAALDTSGTLFNLGGPVCKFHSLDVPVLAV